MHPIRKNYPQRTPAEGRLAHRVAGPSLVTQERHPKGIVSVSWTILPEGARWCGSGHRHLCQAHFLLKPRGHHTFC
jgi:hypothetical protein